MISIKHLTKSYSKSIVLNDISIDITAGQSVALVGPNGSGKSTFMKCILGLVFPKQGNILISGEKISHDGNYRKNIGYMPQIVRFPENMKVYQLFSMISNLRKTNAEIDDELILAFDIRNFNHKPLGSLSGGMKQRVNACLAFMFDPQIYILDEPTAGLDPLSSEILKLKIKKEIQKGKLILISSHILADLEEITSHVLYLIDGKIKFFTPLDLLKAETGSENLSKAIAKFMEKENLIHENH